MVKSTIYFKEIWFKLMEINYIYCDYLIGDNDENTDELFRIQCMNEQMVGCFVK